MLRSYQPDIHESLIHGGLSHNTKVELDYIDSEALGAGEPEALERLRAAQGLLIPGGFGERGVEGKIKAVEIARKEQIPFFGICLGLQIAVIEYARNVAGIANATSQEFDDKASDQVIARY